MNKRRFPIVRLLPVLAVYAIGASLAANAQSQKYRYRQAGSGGPVVVFEYGLGDDVETWEAVQREVSKSSVRDIVVAVRGQ